MIPGAYNLGDAEVTTSVTGQVITDGSLGAYIGDLDGMASVSLQAKLAYGSNGTTCIVVVQTSLDQGLTWIDVARFDFATSSATKTCNLSAAAAAAIASVAALGAEGKTDGILGDRLRAKITTAGTYAGNTAVSVRAIVR